MAASLLKLVGATRGLEQQRAIIEGMANELGAGPFAHELEHAVERSTLGHADGRDVQVAIASWVVGRLVDGDTRAIERIGDAANLADLPLVRAFFSPTGARRVLPRHGRLADIGIAVHRRLDGNRMRFRSETAEDWAANRAWVMHSPKAARFVLLSEIERLRMHHHPVLVARLLDQRWIDLRDVLVIAARRPTTSEITLAIASRPRWFARAAVRDALLANPFTPAALVLALLPAATSRELALLRSAGASRIADAARLVLSMRSGRPQHGDARDDAAPAGRLS